MVTGGREIERFCLYLVTNFYCHVYLYTHHAKIQLLKPSKKNIMNQVEAGWLTLDCFFGGFFYPLLDLLFLRFRYPFVAPALSYLEQEGFSCRCHQKIFPSSSKIYPWRLFFTCSSCFEWKNGPLLAMTKTKTDMKLAKKKRMRWC